MKKTVMMESLQVLFLVGAMVSGLLPAVKAQAADGIRLTVVDGGGLRSGEVKDGTRIARGVVSSREKHSGFHVWSDAQASGNKPERYVLTGLQDGGNHLRVRLESNSWSPDTVDGKGIKKGTDEDGASFDIVVDGDQRAASDRYRFDLRADTISDSSGKDDNGDVTAQTVYINVTQTVKLVHNLDATQSSFSTSLSVLTDLAKGTVSAEDGSVNKYAIRFTDGTCDNPSGATYGIFCTLRGENSPDNTLYVQLNSIGDFVFLYMDGWLVAQIAREKIHYVVAPGKGTDNVPADRYKLSVDAAIWLD
ncbi:hypothetical protein HCH73_06060 [Citrobacter koseri]|uniref:AfaD family invasin n=1 Tax=Citrobacter koseri TaxID=545 RepID=UPI0018E1C47B|nr:AfaD family invasin [Citrobacter koseri]MBI0676607.1 hypothetical protein [Citrobacter koseri]